MSWIQTFTGLKVFPLRPDPQVITISDIAHALANKCRFGGHCTSFYSVAQHSVLVSDWLKEEGAPIETQMQGLLHDGAEAYLPDLARPVKKFFYVQVGSSFIPFKTIERMIQNAIAQGILREPLGWVEHPMVKLADNVLLATEQRDLMADPPEPWRPGPEAWGREIVPLAPMDAMRSFVNRFIFLNEHYLPKR